jgi:hypothetical protein
MIAGPTTGNCFRDPNDTSWSATNASVQVINPGPIYSTYRSGHAGSNVYSHTDLDAEDLELSRWVTAFRQWVAWNMLALTVLFTAIHAWAARLIGLDPPVATPVLPRLCHCLNQLCPRAPPGSPLSGYRCSGRPGGPRCRCTAVALHISPRARASMTSRAVSSSSAT